MLWPYIGWKACGFILSLYDERNAALHFASEQTLNELKKSWWAGGLLIQQPLLTRDVSVCGRVKMTERGKNILISLKTKTLNKLSVPFKILQSFLSSPASSQAPTKFNHTSLHWDNTLLRSLSVMDLKKWRQCQAQPITTTSLLTGGVQGFNSHWEKK